MGQEASSASVYDTIDAMLRYTVILIPEDEGG